MRREKAGRHARSDIKARASSVHAFPATRLGKADRVHDRHFMCRVQGVRSLPRGRPSVKAASHPLLVQLRLLMRRDSRVQEVKLQEERRPCPARLLSRHLKAGARCSAASRHLASESTMQRVLGIGAK